jgi:hypothetical protein
MQRAVASDLLCFFPTQAYRGSFGPAIKPTLSYDASGHTPLKQRDQPFVNSGGGVPLPGPEPVHHSWRRRQTGADLAAVNTDAELRIASGLALMG